MAEELLKTEFDSAQIIFNRFKSAIAYKPTITTVLSPDVRLALLSAHLPASGLTSLCPRRLRVFWPAVRRLQSGQVLTVFQVL